MAKAFEVTLQGQYRGELVINRLSFASSIDDPTVSGAFQLANALGYNASAPTVPTASSVLEAFLIPQTTYYTLDKVFVRNLASVTDFYQVLLSGAGWDGSITGSTTASAASYQTAKLTTNRTRTDVKAGTLALTPPSEGSFDVDGVIVSGTLDLLQDICDALNAPPSYTVGELTCQYFPSVFKKELYVPDPLKPTKTAYRYPEDINAMLTASAIGVTWSPVNRVSTQNSRKIGKGR